MSGILRRADAFLTSTRGRTTLMIAQTFRACILLLPKIIVLALAARVPSRSNLLPNGQSKGKRRPISW